MDEKRLVKSPIKKELLEEICTEDNDRLFEATGAMKHF